MLGTKSFFFERRSQPYKKSNAIEIKQHQKIIIIIMEKIREKNSKGYHTCSSGTRERDEKVRKM